MTTDRWTRIESAFSQIEVARPLGHRLCGLACSLLDATKASIGLLTGNHFTLIDATDNVARSLTDHQFALGDGPAFEAAHTETPVLAPDLTSPPAGARWPAFVPVALDMGVRAELAFPLRVGAARLGVLTAYNDTPARIEPEAVADAMVMATFAADMLVGFQAGEHAQPGSLSSNFTNVSEVHQAGGMVSEQLGISIVEALVRLRSHAYASNTPLSAIARKVVDGQLTLDP
jgi:GAF domain-containing protein